MAYNQWPAYVPVAERRKKAEKKAAKIKKAGTTLAPIPPTRGAIAKTFWGKAWCDNLVTYSDYSNRMPRGRTYARNGSVIDLNITQGSVQALVMGSTLYKVVVKVGAVPEAQWRLIGQDCAGSIDSLVELLQGKLSTAVMQRICAPHTGLFPATKDISFGCSCPDSASMCKHVAAVLYGVGARLDQQPELLFSLRQVDAKDLVNQAGVGAATPRKGLKTGKVLDNAMLSDVFGIEMDEELVPDPMPSPSPIPSPRTSVSPSKKKIAVKSKVVKAAVVKKAKPRRSDPSGG